MSPSHSIETILGIPEDNSGGDTLPLQEDKRYLEKSTEDTTGLSIDLMFYEVVAASSDHPFMEGLHDDANDGTIVSTCPFTDLTKPVPGPHSEWIREDLDRNAIPNISVKKDSSTLWWIDLRPQQQQQNEKDRHVNNLSTQEEVIYMLRNILTPLHDVSPWLMHHGSSNPCTSRVDEASEKKKPHGRPDVVVFVMSIDHPLISLMEDLRVSDIAPSWFLHARAEMEHIEIHKGVSRAPADKKTGLIHFGCSTIRRSSSSSKENTSSATMLIYKKLGPRPNLLVQQPCSKTDMIQELDVHEKKMAIKGCLWEAYLEKCDDKDEESPSCSSNDGEPMTSSQCFRLVCPPYLNLNEEYRGTRIPELFSPDSIRVLLKDALSIRHWTPWPESVHYKVNSSNGETSMPWTVFPLCYCFPSNQPKNLSWVSTTRSYVPETCALLEAIVGPQYLRTALFSQLAANSVLEAHTGWADLANHVLRLHIPLVVPQEPFGLCGTWVDGCVETHAVGRPLLFDDSKIHRAFNYSNDARIVLIVDLARPDHLPPGYAVGGHTDELDAFIQQMSLPR
jgi:hypothetical protein